MRRVSVLVSAVALVACASAAIAGSIGVGDRFPAFTVSAWDGGEIRDADLAGKPVIVDFWASWCVVCRTALPALDATARRLADRGVVVLAVDVDRDRATADAWLEKQLPDRRLRLAHDADGSLLARVGAGGMPAVYVVDRDGVVRFAESGYAPDRVEAIERAAEKLLAAER